MGNAKTAQKLLILLVVAFAAYVVFFNLSRANKTKVDITVIPYDAAIYLGTAQIHDGINYITPGTYTLRASRSGFANTKEKIVVSDTPLSVTLLPEPSSPEGEDWINKHPEEQTKREALAGEKYNKEGVALANKQPILNRLPIFYNHGESSISSKPSERVDGNVSIVVEDTTTTGRASIIKWMYEQGYTPGDMEVVFPDYLNPLVNQEGD